jgi:hypothetical protein
MSKSLRLKHQFEKACLIVGCLVPVITHESWSELHDKSQHKANTKKQIPFKIYFLYNRGLPLR